MAYLCKKKPIVGTWEQKTDNLKKKKGNVHPSTGHEDPAGECGKSRLHQDSICSPSSL
jgi:hypothetical protein